MATPYFTSTCLQDSGAVCGDPLSYERKCASLPHQVLAVYSVLHVTIHNIYLIFKLH